MTSEVTRESVQHGMTHPSALSLLPETFRASLPAPQILAQGAEALVFRTHFLYPSRPCVLKYRPPKTWRHPTLDARLTRHRILSEARMLVRCRREGVLVPAVLALDWEGSKVESGERSGGWMMVEWIQGSPVRAALNKWTKWTKNLDQETSERHEEELVSLMVRMGKAVGNLHAINICHGDLTTSNLMLKEPDRKETNGSGGSANEKDDKPNLEGDIVLIDFGLALQAKQDEERAVDLYVLERAFGSTHPTIEDRFAEVLKAYGESYKGARTVLKRLEEVRMRGRKRSMVG